MRYIDQFSERAHSPPSARRSRGQHTSNLASLPQQQHDRHGGKTAEAAKARPSAKAMPPKSKAAGPAADEPSPKKATVSAEEAASAIAGAASKITTSAKAVAAGTAESVPRTPTERRPRAENGLVMVHWNVCTLQL